MTVIGATRHVLLWITIGLLLGSVAALAEEPGEAAGRDSTRADSLWMPPPAPEMHPDSLRAQGLTGRWLLPAGIVVATGAAVFLLFAVRSR